MKLIDNVVRKADQVQQDTRPLAFAVGVVRKFGDDRGGQLAAQLTYYGFLSLFPLLLLLITVLDIVLGGQSSWAHRVEHSALSQFPIVGNQLGSNLHRQASHGAAGIVVGVVGLAWGSQGALQSAQFAMAEVWNVPNIRRPGYWARLGRSVAAISVLGLFLVVSTVLAGGAFSGHGPLVVVASVLVSVGVNVALFVMAYRLLTPLDVRWAQLLPGGVAAGVAWTVVQFAGSALVAHTLRHAGQLYGVFGTVLGLLAWIYLGAQIFLYAAEVNVVHARRLWPRSLVQPPLTRADRTVVADLALEERRRPEQELQVTFDADAVDGNGEGEGEGEGADRPEVEDRVRQ